MVYINQSINSDIYIYCKQGHVIRYSFNNQVIASYIDASSQFFSFLGTSSVQEYFFPWFIPILENLWPKY